MSFFKNLNDNTKGLLSMLLGQLSFAINDTVVKYTVKLSETNFSVFNILFIRGIITCVLIYFIIIILYRKENRKIRFQKEFFYRGLFEVLTAFFFFIALILMPIANVYTLLMTTPLIVTATAAIFLREKVGIRRWTAVIIGFIGVIIVINPKNLEFGYLFILPIISAIFLTLRDIVTKNVANKNNSLEIILITSFCIVIFSGVASIFYPGEIKYEYFFYIIISSIFLFFGYLFSVLTVFYAPLSLTASIRYSVIIFGMILGYLFLNEIPSINMFVGALLISLSGLFVIKRQKELGKIR